MLLIKNNKPELVNYPYLNTNDTIVTKTYYFQSLEQTNDALNRVVNGINNGISNDFVAQDICQALFHLGEIKGEVTTDDLLENIFSKFCIGK